MKLLRYWSPVVMWMIIIFLFSSKQKVQISDQGTVNFIFFKTLHVLEYAMLYFLSFRAIKNTAVNKSSLYWFAFAYIITIVFALSDEIHQTYVPTREGRPRDVIIDGLGAILAWISINQLLPRAPKKLQHWVKHWHLL